jgi:hypothetical protein
MYHNSRVIGQAKTPKLSYARPTNLAEAVKLLKKHHLIPNNVEPELGRVVGRKLNVHAALKELWGSKLRRRTAMLWISWVVLVYT